MPNLRLRCRAHNQLAAEQAFGAGTMREKREAARARAEQARARKHTQVAPSSEGISPVEASKFAPLSPPAAPAPPIAPDLDVRPWLRQLRFSAAEARLGAELCAHMVDAPLEARVRFAIASLAPKCARPIAPFAKRSP